MKKPRLGAGLTTSRGINYTRKRRRIGLDWYVLLLLMNKNEPRTLEQRLLYSTFALVVNTRYNNLMHIWDYREKALKKTAWGRRYILENMINMGPGRKKISLSQVKKEWNFLNIDPLRRNLLRFLIWGKR